MKKIIAVFIFGALYALFFSYSRSNHKKKHEVHAACAAKCFPHPGGAGAGQCVCDITQEIR